jgi:UDP-N-acetylmuramate dehydrogenase
MVQNGMVNTQSITSNNLSFYRTTHHFERYGEFCTVDQLREYYNLAKANNSKLYILGNGSNTLFTKSTIKTLVLKNNLPKSMTFVSPNKIEVSSSVLVIDVLKLCYENSLDSFYYLASVPATVGGALAMNAGRGKTRNQTIYDFVESVTFFDLENNSLKTITEKEEIIKGYRTTIFTGIKSKLILSVIFKFSQINIEGNPIQERCKWSKKHQDYSAPNCGSVFKEKNSNLMNLVKGLYIGKAGFSAKTTNWILNNADNSMNILILIKLVKLLHFLIGKSAVPEVISVD